MRCSPQVVTTTFCSGSPRMKRLMLPATSAQRRATMPWVQFAEREDLLDPPPPLPRAAVRRDDAAAESGGAARDLIADPAEPDDADRAAQDLAMRRPALHPAGLP